MRSKRSILYRKKRKKNRCTVSVFTQATTVPISIRLNKRQGKKERGKGGKKRRRRREIEAIDEFEGWRRWLYTCTMWRTVILRKQITPFYRSTASLKIGSALEESFIAPFRYSIASFHYFLLFLSWVRSWLGLRFVVPFFWLEKTHLVASVIAQLNSLIWML